jgi:hypothetical protein
MRKLQLAACAALCIGGYGVGATANDETLALHSGETVVGRILACDDQMLWFRPSGIDSIITIERARVRNIRDVALDDVEASSRLRLPASHHWHVEVLSAAIYDMYETKTAGVGGGTVASSAIGETHREPGVLVQARCLWQTGPSASGPVLGCGFGMSDGGQLTRAEPMLIGGWAWQNDDVRCCGLVQAGWSFATLRRRADVIDTATGTVVDQIDADEDLDGPVLAVEVDVLRHDQRWSYGISAGVSVRRLSGASDYTSKSGTYAFEDDLQELIVWSPYAGLILDASW